MRDASPLDHPVFVRFLVVRVLITLAAQAQGVAIGWQVYDLTGHPLDLGWVGLAQFAPMLLLAIPGGQVADRYDRVHVFAGSIAAMIACTALLVVGVVAHVGVPLILAAAVLFGASRAFSMPAASPLGASLVPANVLPQAVAWSGSVWQVGAIAGPAIGGGVYALGGPLAVYAMAGVLGIVGLGLILTVRAPPVAGAPRATSVAEVLSGVRFVARSPVLLGAMGLDLCAVLLGGATALLPIFAADILDAGPIALGALRAAPAVGATATALLLARRPLAGNAGNALYASVAAFGVATIVFGASRSLALSIVALAAAGAADMVSVVIRGTLLQLHTPPEVRGRVSAVNLVFVGASNELGEFESGVLAEHLGAVKAVIVGGVGTLVVVAAWAVLFPALRKVDRLDDAGPLADNHRPGGSR